MPFWPSTKVDMVDATKRRVLATGLIAGLLILWLAGSFWVDAWTQYQEARQIRGAFITIDASSNLSSDDFSDKKILNADLSRITDQLYDKAHPTLTGLIPYATLKMRIAEVDQLVDPSANTVLDSNGLSTLALDQEFEPFIRASRLQDRQQALVDQLSELDGNSVALAQASTVSELSDAVARVTRRLIDSNHEVDAQTTDISHIRSNLAALDADMSQHILKKASAVEAHAERRMLIDTILILICLWIGVSSQRLLSHIHQQAYYDRRTGLPNRFKLEKIMGEASLDSTSSGLSLIEITDLDQTNDSFGKEISDKLLHAVGERFEENAGERSTVAAIGDSRFAVFFEQLSELDSAEKRTQSVLTAAEEPFNIDGVILRPRLRAGISLSPEHGTTVRELFQKSELAMSLSSSVGGDRFLCFSNKLSEQHQARVQLEIDLRTAVEEKQFSLHYQPKVCTRTGLVHSVEALVRWEHPTRGMVSPFHFISVAEQCGLIGQIGAWVMDEAIRQTVCWQHNGLEDLQVAVNVSAEQFLEDGFIQKSLNAIELHGLRDNSLELEITESVAMADIKKVIAGLSELRNAGVQIAIDDFGTDYSSLKVLDDLPVDVLKIDRSFITRLDDMDYERSLVNTIVSMARTLGLKTVAEGVETESQLEKIHKIGCDYIQGYYFAKPVPADTLEETIKAIASRQAPWSDRAA